MPKHKKPALTSEGADSNVATGLTKRQRRNVRKAEKSAAKQARYFTRSLNAQQEAAGAAAAIQSDTESEPSDVPSDWAFAVEQGRSTPRPNE